MGDASHCRWLWHVCRRRSREWSQQSQHASSAAVVVQGFPATSVAPFRRARGAATAGRTSERRHPWPCAAEDARRRIHARMISNGLGFSSFFLLGCRPINRSLCCKLLDRLRCSACAWPANVLLDAVRWSGRSFEAGSGDVW